MIRKENFRLMLVSTGLTICCVSDGFIFGQMSGMINALQTKDSSIHLSDEDISWIASTINIICIVGFAFVGTIADIFGRRRAMTIINLPVIASWILLYFAKDKTTLIISRLIVGVCFGGALLLVYINVGEYHPPKVRPLSLNLIACVGILIGATLGHVLGIMFHWRYVALVGIIPSSLAAIIPCFWIESPVWLASKGKFNECEKAFRALHPSNEETNRELGLLLAFEKKKLNESSTKTSRVTTLKTVAKAFTKKYFWKISALSTVVCIYRIAGGKILFTTLAISMLQDITRTSDILLFTLVVDGFTIVGAMISCVILMKYKIRDILFISGLIANVCLMIFALSLYCYPGNNYYLSWLKVFLLALYFVIATAGPYPILEALLTEIFPLEIKSFLVVIIGVITGTLQFTSIKFATNMITAMGYHGFFFLNSVIIFLCLVYLWFYLPETKGRSLHEIEYYFKNGTFDYNKQTLNFDQTTELLSSGKTKKTALPILVNSIQLYDV